MRRGYNNEIAVSRQAENSGRSLQRERTRNAILDAARALIKAGRVPTVPEAAEAAQVSRATAYRYFPSQGPLLHATYDDVMTALTAGTFEGEDAAERVDEALCAAFTGILEHEPFMRAALRLALEQWAIERAGGELSEERPPRGGRRRVIDDALSVLEDEMDPDRLARLKATLGMVFGIEGHIAVRDVYGLDEDSALETMRWAARVAVDSALREEAQDRRRRKRERTRSR
jgi:AcrR family transcriptional regulator